VIDLCLVVAGQDEAECALFDETYVNCESRLIVNRENRSLAAIGNEALDQTARSVFGLCHPDIYFGQGAIEAFYTCAMAGNVCGVAGRKRSLRYFHSRDNPGIVSCLDDCCIFFRRDSGLRFDAETFDGFCCYAPDLCLQAESRGIPSTVPAADAHHRGNRYLTDHAGHLNPWFLYLEKLKTKWAGVEFATT